MSERSDILGNLRHLVELDRAFGVDFFPRVAAAPVTRTNSPASAPAIPASGTRAPAAPAAAAAPLVTPGAQNPQATSQARIPATPVSSLPAVDLEQIAQEVNQCTRCKLCKGRTKAVPGEGEPTAELLFIGEGPGAEEDAQGRPFVGPAGQLLTRMILAMGLQRSEVFIANVVKCRPPQNRLPEPDEVASCLPYLHRQIAVIKPKVICTLGNTPLRALFNDPNLGITRQRGRVMSYAGITVIPTFHPSYLLRNADAKKPCWEDLRAVLGHLGRAAPGRSAT